MKYLTQVLISLVLLSSLGICWQKNYDCQQGQYYASIFAFILLFISIVRYKIINWGTICTFFPIIIWCQIVNMLLLCWNLESIQWHISLLIFFIIGQNLHFNLVFKCIGTTCLFVLTIYVLSSFGIIMPFTLQVLDNPAGLAVVTVLGWSCFLPKLYLLLTYHVTNIRNILLCIFSLCLFLFISTILYNSSRTGLISLVLSTIFFMTTSFRHNFSKKQSIILLVLGTFFIGVFLYLLYLRNPDSVNGRFLIYRTIIKMCLEHPLYGWGTNALESHYMESQAIILQTVCNNGYFHWLAGDIVRPFNEILNCILCYGFIGCVLAIVPLFFLLKRCSSNRRKRLFTLLMAWFFLGTASYPSYYPFACSLMMIMLGTISSQPPPKAYLRIKNSFVNESYLLLGVCFCGILLSVFQISRKSTKEKWLATNTTSFVDKKVTERGPPTYIYDDKEVLYAYAVNLNLLGQYTKSLYILNRLKGQLHNYDTELLAADNALSLQQWDIAIEKFNNAHRMVPIRFMPLYGLMQTYLLRGDRTMAYHLAIQILEKKIKVNSEDVRFVKKEARNLLKQKSHKQ